MPSLRPYPSYRNTDLPWLAQIPTHWEVKRIKELARQEYKSFVDGDWIESPYIVQDEGIRLIQTGNIGIGKYKEQGYRYITEDTFRKLDCTEFFPGDILICRLAEPVGRACLAPDLGTRMITSVDVCILKPQNKYDSKFIVYYLSSDQYLNWLTVLSRGSTRDRISRSMLGDIHIPAPPLPEQQTIAAYLDRQTAKIDALIAKKQRLLDLLAEQRAALISQAVTKGNARNNVQKDNGPAPWLFPLPAGWEREKLKFNSFMKGRIGYENLRSDEYTNEGPFLVSSVHFKDGKIEWDKCNHVTRERFEMSPDIILQKDDVLFMKDGALMGKLAYLDELPGEACLNSHLLLIRPKNGKYLPKFLLYVLMTDVFEAYMIEERKGTTFFGFSQESMGNFPISLPSISEQKEICDYIERKTKQLDDLAAKAEAVIERLREYRAALISSAVTGKIKV